MSTLKKYRTILFKGTIAVSLAGASTQIAALILLPLFTFYLSPADYGIFSLVSLTITILALIYNPGVMSATIRLFHNTTDESERKLLIGSAHLFFLLIPIIPIIVGLAFGEQIFKTIFSDFDFYPFGLMALILAFFIQPSRIWTTLLTLQYKIRRTSLQTAISVLIGMMFSIVLVVVFKMGAMGYVLGMFPAAIYLFIISLIDVKKFTQGKWSVVNMKKQLIFGFPLIPALWAYQGLNFIGKYMLEIMGNLHNVGLYSFAVSISSAPMILVLGFKQLWSPIFYENMNNKDYRTISQLISYFVIFITLLCVVIMLFSKEAILLLINNRYYSIISINSFLIVAVYFSGLLTISNTLLSYNNKFKNISIFACVAILVNIVLNWYLIPIYGILGAAISLAVSYFVFFIIGAINQKNTLRLIQESQMTIIPPLIVIVTSIASYLLTLIFNINKISSLEVSIKLISLVIIIVTLFATGILRKNDWKYLQSMLKNYRIKKK